MEKYDPWEHAAQMEVAIVEWPLRVNKGLWVPEDRTIYIRPRQRSFVERSVLTHECAHAENNDPAGHHPRHEARANLIAAQRLIDPRELATLVRLYPDGDKICRELGVTRELFNAFLSQTKQAS